MTGLVIDASSVLAWCFEDESGPEADALIEKVAAEGAAVPGVWSLEIANGLVMAERRNQTPQFCFCHKKGRFTALQLLFVRADKKAAQEMGLGLK
jgi:predicted nucleic acid-binding protein